jgi:hypothetical protein
MTRINILDPEHLSDQHLLAEYRELPRIFTLVANGKAKGVPGADYTLGTGHVTFFYDKLYYLYKRYYRLVAELRSRKYDITPINPDDLWLVGTTDQWKDYKPTPEAIIINLERLLDKLNTQPSHTYEKGPVDHLKHLYALKLSGVL